MFSEGSTMKVHLSGLPNSLMNARAWVCKPRLRTVLDDLERAIEARQAGWGEAYVFIEVPAPGTNPHHSKQIDLLIAFSDRLVICELKEGAAKAHLPESKAAANRAFQQ